MLTLTELRSLVQLHGPLEIMWDHMDNDPLADQEFTEQCALVQQMIPGLEHLYTGIAKGSITVEDSETLLINLQQELYAAYLLEDAYERYAAVHTMTTAHA